MSKNPLPDNTGGSTKMEPSTAELDNLLQIIVLASDLRAGEGKAGKYVEDALYTKLDYAAISGIEDFFEMESEDIKERLIELIYSHFSAGEIATYEGGTSTERQVLLKQAKSKIDSNPLEKKAFSLSVAATRGIKKCLDNFEENSGFGDLDEFGTLLLEAVSDLNKLRVTHDVIPLLQRGLYASEVRSALEFWKNNCNDPAVCRAEGAWQKELTARISVLQRALGGKAILLNTQAHVGSEGLDGKGDRITDFLFQHSDTRNIVIVEIKTPETPLLGISYRNTYALSEDLSGTVSQVLLQRHEAMTNFYSKRVKSEVDFNVAAPRCVIIAGRLDKEINGDKLKLAAFEMQRQAIESNVRIITFDELYKDFSSFHLLDD